MKIVKDYPPNIDRIREKFNLSGNEIFAWGDTIYSPKSETLPPWLVEHEKVHSRQQGDDPEYWWDLYLKDDGFRFDQELEAHRVEYQVFCQYHPERNHRRIALKQMAKRLASPMYGKMVTFEKAKRMLK